jgi:hypothetical protein
MFSIAFPAAASSPADGCCASSIRDKRICGQKIALEPRIGARVAKADQIFETATSGIPVKVLANIQLDRAFCRGSEILMPIRPN